MGNYICIFTVAIINNMCLIFSDVWMQNMLCFIGGIMSSDEYKLTWNLPLSLCWVEHGKILPQRSSYKGHTCLRNFLEGYRPLWDVVHTNMYPSILFSGTYRKILLFCNRTNSWCRTHMYILTCFPLCKLYWR